MGNQLKTIRIFSGNMISVKKNDPVIVAFNYLHSSLHYSVLLILLPAARVSMRQKLLIDVAELSCVGLRHGCKTVPAKKNRTWSGGQQL